MSGKRRRTRRKGEEESPEYALLKSLRSSFLAHAERCGAPRAAIGILASWLLEQMEEETVFDAVVVADQKLGGPATEALLAALVETYDFVAHLVLWRTESGSQGASAVARLLHTSSSLVSLEMVDIGMGARPGADLGRALQLNASLKSLTLDHNPAFGAQGVAGLATGLRWNESLTKLSMRFCGLDAAAGAVLGSKILPYAGALAELDVYGNALGAPGIHALVKGLPHAQCLATLNVGDNGAHHPPRKVYRRLATVLPVAPALTALNIDGNLVSEEGAQLLLAALEDAPRIVSFDLTDRIDHDTTLAFKALEKVHAKAAGKKKRRRKKAA
ncbi:uncharacterized protein AMSG_09962 [Thecamonas trahens ATCC 50062]|uniref:NOD3 protein n=1 Tax=Thecamonas trahens ATCC 50062 TaxID=461836 RepID=A0A0L0DQ76_THETB|nr:hypothetical protein AMSG_09962 [Thecamonas trahens ATCC 50062]KNC54176.1 hypothetical protein AMSG_09962 [Thecamonas trahens ATCC 50062]|eukprot:XP_013753992.1 hypothetical protein AMSG_09962 [Thecamonas trahens ATCC 50062]